MNRWPDDPFTRADLRALDLTESDLRRAHRSGVIRSVLRGVFVVSTRSDGIELRAAALARAVGPHQVVTDRTAAWLHGVDAHVYGELDGEPVVEACALRWNAPTMIGGVDGRTRDLTARDTMLLHGVRVTTPLRTALDLGCCLRRREAYAAMCALARGHDFTRVDLVRELSRYRRRRGVIQLRSLAGLVDPRFESQREAWCFLAIADAELPLPEPQLWIEIDGVPTYRLDLAYRRRKVCVEYDGGEHHSTPEQRAHDERRRGWLRDHGWTVIVVEHGDFTADALDRWLRTLRAALEPTYANRRW
ncbi:DUF559 domain-containing protein [Nocardioides sp. CN2-186]|uniref:DUF559 domain-containing protein n=1 Tax=Nocardioides tweenelious TaxID=3156607 RepID=UPI0032B611F8